MAEPRMRRVGRSSNASAVHTHRLFHCRFSIPKSCAGFIAAFRFLKCSCSERI